MTTKDRIPTESTWRQLLLADADATIEANSIATTFSENASGASIEVAADTTIHVSPLWTNQTDSAGID